MRVIEMKAGQSQSLLHIKIQGDRGSGSFLLPGSGCTLHPRRHCDMVLTLCPTCSVCQKRRARRGEWCPGASEGVLASFPDEAVPSQKSREETGLCAQVRTGPSLCRTGSGWKPTCEGRRDGSSAV